MLDGRKALRRLARACAALSAAIAATLAESAPAFADPSSTTIEQGYEMGEVQHPHSQGMGGANNALGTSTVSIFQNPATLPVARVYHFEALAAISPEARRQSYGVSVADSSTNRLAGGFGGVWSGMDPDKVDRTWTDLRLALAYPFGERLSFGLTGRYVRVSQAVTAGPLGASLASDGTRDQAMVSHFTFDAGALVSVSQNVRIGLVGHNLSNPAHGLMPTTLAGGIGYTAGVFGLEADGLLDFTTYSKTRGRFMAGGFYLIGDRFPVRAGYRFDAGSKAHSMTLGAGYVDRQFSVDVSVRRDLVATFPATFIMIGLRFFYVAGVAPDDSDGIGVAQ
jgi:hypothetical protein